MYQSRQCGIFWQSGQVPYSSSKPRSTIKSHAAERNVPRISELVSLPGTEGTHVRNTKSRSAAQVKAGPPSLSNSGVVSTSMLGPSARCMVRILRQYPHHRSFCWCCWSPTWKSTIRRCFGGARFSPSAVRTIFFLQQAAVCVRVLELERLKVEHRPRPSAKALVSCRLSPWIMT